jgi:predicted ribosomally synthesized peptide with nif11-like leader
MSQANLDLFLAEARKNQSLSDQVRATRSHEELIKLAGENGHQLSKATVVRNHLHRLAGLSDDELENIGEQVFDSDFGDVFLGRFI